MSATTFSIPPLDANAPVNAVADGAKKASLSRPPTITLPLPPPSPPLSPAQPNSAPPPRLNSPTSPPHASDAVAVVSSRSRRRAPARSQSPPLPAPSRKKARKRSPAPRSLPYPPPPVVSSPVPMKTARTTTKGVEPEEEAPFLTEQHKPVYQTHLTFLKPQDELDEQRSPRGRAPTAQSKKSVTMSGVDASIEDRRARFYRFLHEYHIHATDEDLSRHEVIFPPGILQGEGDMSTFLSEFTSLQSSYSALLSLLSALPQLCLSLNADGFLVGYNVDPSAFMGSTLSQLSSLPYQRWFDSGVTGGRAPPRRGTNNGRNAQLLSSIALAFSSRETIREEHLMFMGSKGKSVPCTVTCIPVLHGKAGANTTSFEDRYLIGTAGSLSAGSTRSAYGSPSSSASSSFFSRSSALDMPLQVHAFSPEELLAQEEAAMNAAAARTEQRSREINRVVVLIENKELIYRLGQQTKRVKETLRPERRRSSYEPGASLGLGGQTDGDMTRRKPSVLVVQPKLDTGISSALTLMSTLAGQERNAAKKRMYAQIIHMLSHSKGMESVNDDVINQIEDNEDVGKELKSWLINQINPTNSSDERIDEKDKDKEAKKEKEAKKAEEEAAAVAAAVAAVEEQAVAAAAAVVAYLPAGDKTALPKDGGLQAPARGATGIKTAVDSAIAKRRSTLHVPGTVDMGSSGASADEAKSMQQPLSPGAAAAVGRMSVKSQPIAATSPSHQPAVAEARDHTDDGQSAVPRSLSHHADDGQFVDPSPEVSLLSRDKRLSSKSAAGAGGGVIPTGRGSEKHNKHNRVLKERRSVAERRAAGRRGSSGGGSRPRKSQSTLTPIVGPTSPGGAVVVQSPQFAPARESVSLPLLQPMQQQRPQVVERAADARVLYNNWSAAAITRPRSARYSSPALNGQDGKRDSAESIRSTADDPAGAPDVAVVVKESIFMQVGCAPPEVHHNAALDCNSQTLFWSNLQAHPLRPTTTTASTAKPHPLLHSPIYLTPSAESALASTLSVMSVWNQFNIFHVSAHSQGWPLTFTFTTVINQLGLLGKWGIDAALLSNFIREVERGYFANPYHSSTHAADVLQHAYHMITQTHLGLSLSDMDVFILLVAAAVHDYGHPGVNNQYLTTSFSPLALQYNDRNVLESYHIASIFLMMQSKPDTNLFQHMDTATYRRARKMLIDLVLATDLSSHFDILAVWKRKESILDCNKDEDKMLIMQMILKSGDLGHPSRVRHLHLTWSELITEEFFQQGDREKKNGMNVSAMMDRNTCNIVTSQIGFISFLVMPIYTAFAPYIGTDMYAMTVRANLAMWERLNLESEELRKVKEEEEMELRRLVLEREIIEQKRRKEQHEREDEQRRRAAVFEAEMQKQREEEEEAKRKEEEMLKAKQLMESELKHDAELKQSDEASQIIDIRLRRENDSEWTLADISDSDDEQQQDDAELNEERRRRRSKKLRLTEQEREEARMARKQEKLEQRQREREEKRKREQEDRQTQLLQQEEEERHRKEQWERSKEREDAEIEGRLRAISAVIASKMRRGRADSADEEQKEDDEKMQQRLREAQQRKKRDFEQQAADAADSAQAHTGQPEKTTSTEQQLALPESKEQIAARPPSPRAVEQLVLPIGDDTAEDGGGRYVSEIALSPTSLQRASFAERMRDSIARDRERVAAEQKLRVEKEKKRLISAEERRAEEEAARLERKVKRLLRREQAAARAKAKGEKIDSLFEAASEHKEDKLSKKERVLDSARQKARRAALREVSMLMMDKDWGVRRDRAEEARIMQEYLKYVTVDDDDDDDAAPARQDDEDDERRRRELERQRLRQTATATAALPQLAHVVSRVSSSQYAEEWEDDSERGHHRVSTASAPGPNASNGVIPDISDAPDEDDHDHDNERAAWDRAAQPDRDEHDDDDRQTRRSRAQALATDDSGVVSQWRRRTPVMKAAGGSRRHRKNTLSVTFDSTLHSMDSDMQEVEAAEASTNTQPERRHSVEDEDDNAQAMLDEDDERVERYEDEDEKQRGDEDEEDDQQRRQEEEKEDLLPPPEVAAEDSAGERARKRDKRRALASQTKRAARERAADRQRAGAADDGRGGSKRQYQQTQQQRDPSDRYPALSSSALQSSSSPSTSPDPVQSPSSSSTFTSFPPLAPSVAAAVRSFATALAGPGSAAAEGLLLSRSLIPAKADPLSYAQQHGTDGSDWHAMDDEQAMAAILRRVIPRSRQAEIERARRAIVTKQMMRQTQ